MPALADPFATDGVWLRCALHAHTTNSDGELPPRWSGLRTAQFDDCEGLVGVEIWNAGCELEVGRGDSTSHWDEALESGHRLFGIAADDSHRPGIDSRHAWTWVRARERSADAVLAALRGGLAYGSTGPEIASVAVEGEDVVVRCSPAANVTLFTGRAVGARANAAGDADELVTDAEVLDRDGTGALTAVQLRRPWHAPYGRVEVADARGRRAWTNPLWLD